MAQALNEGVFWVLQNLQTVKLFSTLKSKIAQAAKFVISATDNYSLIEPLSSFFSTLLAESMGTECKDTINNVKKNDATQ